jgi:hypothetical protein
MKSGILRREFSFSLACLARRFLYQLALVAQCKPDYNELEKVL